MNVFRSTDYNVMIEAEKHCATEHKNKLKHTYLKALFSVVYFNKKHLSVESQKSGVIGIPLVGEESTISMSTLRVYD